MTQTIKDEYGDPTTVGAVAKHVMMQTASMDHVVTMSFNPEGALELAEKLITEAKKANDYH